ncbi:MAG: SUMF1/EgtB/PvdO family nonheme iron enzyme, partial [bacterium]|nr:SUMF1/EgtB/PvdO family nonheme iron enzyme [bacterium]
TTIEENPAESTEDRWVEVPAGTYEIGCAENGFCFDNERPRHKVYIENARIRTTLVRNGEFMAFIDDGGYRDFHHWLSDGWAWVQEQQVEAPLYWTRKNGEWQSYTLAGAKPLDPDAPVMHVSYYEAAAFAAWLGLRLPSEQEWEIGQGSFSPGLRWEWTQSAYLPYPGYRPPEGAIGEYNGKFMANQMVLRGPSVATPRGHGRPTYRNFFYPHQRWQYTGIRLAQ